MQARVNSWRYTCWFGFDGVTVTPRIHDIIGRELYDHRGDQGELDWAGEHINVVEGPDNQAIVAQLHALVLGYIRLYPIGV